MINHIKRPNKSHVEVKIYDIEYRHRKARTAENIRTKPYGEIIGNNHGWDRWNESPDR